MTNASRTAPPRTGEVAGPPELPAREAGREPRLLGFDALALERGAHDVLGQGREVDALATRPDRVEQLVGERGHEQDDGARRRLLERLQQRVGRLVAACPCSRSASNRTTTLRAPSTELRDASGMMRSRTSGLDLVRPALGLELDDVGVHAAEHEILRPLVAVGCDQRGGEAAGRVLDSRAARSDEQVGVHGPLGRAPHEVDGAVLPDDAVPHRCRCRVAVAVAGVAVGLTGACSPSLPPRLARRLRRVHPSRRPPAQPRVAARSR